MAEVMEKETDKGTIIHYAECRYCGQQHSVQTIAGASTEELITMATSMCDCEEAIAETRRMDSVNLAKKNIEKLAGGYKFSGALLPFPELMAKLQCDSVSVKYDNVVCSLSLSSNGKIVFKKKITDETSLEA